MNFILECIIPECSQPSEFWLELETNIVASCKSHHEYAKKNRISYSSGEVPTNETEWEQIKEKTIEKIDERLRKRGIKEPQVLRHAETIIYKNLQQTPPKRFEKHIKDYIKSGANELDVQDMKALYNKYNIFQNKKQFPNCTCGEPATWWFQLQYRKIFRCDEHSTTIESPVYSQSKIPEDGITISEADIHQKIDDYRNQESQSYSFQELAEETKNCKICQNMNELAKEYRKMDGDEKNATVLRVYNHIKTQHPKHFSKYTKYEDGIEHCYILEHPDSFFYDFIERKYTQPIPKEWIGRPMSGNQLDQDLLIEIVNSIPELLNYKPDDKHFDALVSFLKKKNLQPVTTMRLLLNLDPPAKTKIRIMTELFGEDNKYTQHMKKFLDTALLMESCEECMRIGRFKHLLPESEVADMFNKHYKKDHPEHFEKLQSHFEEKNLEETYPEDVRYKVAEILNTCKTCHQLMDDEDISDEDAEKQFHNHIQNHHPEITKLININDLIIQPKLLDNGITRIIRTTTKSTQSTKFVDTKKAGFNPTGSELEGQLKEISNYKNKKPKYRSYEDFCNLAKDLNIHSIQDWDNYTKTTQFPEDVPIHPERYYKEFPKPRSVGYATVFGYQVKVRREPLTKEKLKEIVKKFGERWIDYRLYPDSFLMNWFEKQGLFRVSDSYFKNLFKHFIEWRNDPEGIEAIRYWVSTLDLEKEFGEFTLQPKKLETKEEYLDRQVTRLRDVRQQELLEQPKPVGVEAILLNARDVVPDKETDPKWYSTQVRYRVNQVWEMLFDEDDFEKELANLKKQKTGINEFHDDVLNTFWSEYAEVSEINYGKSIYSFPEEPKLIQKYTAYKMRKQNGFFNMSSTGAYKTGSGIISAVATKSKFCLVIVPNAIVYQWVSNIKKFYPDCFVSSGKEIPKNFFVYRGKYRTNFHVINYDKFRNKTSSEKIISQLMKKETVDFVILDESQFIKNSSNPKSIEQELRYVSNRRRYIEQLITKLRAKDRKLKTLMLSATPVVNNIKEAKSLLELITGTKYTFSTHTSIRNAITAYVEFIPFSMKYIKRYNIKEYGRDEPIFVDAYLPKQMPVEQARELSFLELEQIATEYRIPKILEILKNTEGRTVIYTDYVAGIVDKLYDAVSNAGYRVGLFTGENKEGLYRKTGFYDKAGNPVTENPLSKGEIDVVIASRPFAVGIDEVQHYCNNLIFNGFVWTWAQFEQIIGRLVRTGQKENSVNIFLMFARINGYDYDLNIKYKRVKAKKALGDCIKDGTLPEKITLGSTDKERKKAIEIMLKNRESVFPEVSELKQQRIQEAEEELELTAQKIDNLFKVKN